MTHLYDQLDFSNLCNRCSVRQASWQGFFGGFGDQEWRVVIKGGESCAGKGSS
jgi:hypothetical protein